MWTLLFALTMPVWQAELKHDTCEELWSSYGYAWYDERDSSDLPMDVREDCAHVIEHYNTCTGRFFEVPLGPLQKAWRRMCTHYDWYEGDELDDEQYTECYDVASFMHDAVDLLSEYEKAPFLDLIAFYRPRCRYLHATWDEIEYLTTGYLEASDVPKDENPLSIEEVESLQDPPQDSWKRRVKSTLNQMSNLLNEPYVAYDKMQELLDSIRDAIMHSPDWSTQEVYHPPPPPDAYVQDLFDVTKLYSNKILDSIQDTSDVYVQDLFDVTKLYSNKILDSIQDTSEAMTTQLRRELAAARIDLLRILFVLLGLLCMFGSVLVCSLRVKQTYQRRGNVANKQ